MLRVIWIMLLVAIAASTAWAQDNNAVPYKTIAIGRDSRVREPLQGVIRDRAGWQSLWSRHAGGRVLPRPTVDFSRHMVVAVFAGEFKEPAAIAITRITREPGRLTVLFRAGPTRPMPDGVDPVTPFHIVRVARSALPVRFRQMKTPPIVRQP